MAAYLSRLTRTVPTPPQSPLRHPPQRYAGSPSDPNNIIRVVDVDGDSQYRDQDESVVHGGPL